MVRMLLVTSFLSRNVRIDCLGNMANDRKYGKTGKNACSRVADDNNERVARNLDIHLRQSAKLYADNK